MISQATPPIAPMHNLSYIGKSRLENGIFLETYTSLLYIDLECIIMVYLIQLYVTVYIFSLHMNICQLLSMSHTHIAHTHTADVAHFYLVIFLHS